MVELGDGSSALWALSRMAQHIQRHNAVAGCAACAQLQCRQAKPVVTTSASDQSCRQFIPPALISRRHVLSLSAATGLYMLRPSNVQAEPATEQLPSSLGTEANAPGPEEDIFVAVEFSLALPPGFRETAVLPPKPAAARPGFGSFERQVGAAPVSPVKAKFVSDSGAQLSVVVRPAAEIKPTFLQVTDISQYGDIAAAQSVLVPPGCKVLDKSTFKVPQPSRNTGTLAGVVKVPPSTIYRYEFVTGSGVHAVMAAAASKGQVYVAGGTAPNAQWQASAPALRLAVQSFKLN